MLDYSHPAADMMLRPMLILLSVACAVVAARLGGRVLTPEERRRVARCRPAAMAAIAGFVAIELAAPGPALPTALVTGLLSALAAIDLSARRLPDILTLPLLLVAAAFSPADATSSLGGMVFAAGLLAGVSVLFRRIRGYDGLGFGDVKMAAGCGAWLGVQGVGPLLLVSALAALAAVATRRAFVPAAGPAAPGIEPELLAIPFGPFLALATIIVAASQAQGLLP